MNPEKVIAIRPVTILRLNQPNKTKVVTIDIPITWASTFEIDCIVNASIKLSHIQVIAINVPVISAKVFLIFIFIRLGK